MPRSLPTTPVSSDSSRSRRAEKNEADHHMWNPPISSLLAVLLLILSSATAEDRLNRSRGNSLFWSTAKDDSELLAEAIPGDAVDDGETLADEFDGGFSSFDSMLQWAIGNSDPANLKDRANEARRLSAEELQKRREEIKDLMEKLKMPSDAELMQIAIADLNNSSLSSEDRLRALNELLILVEPIDNANDLDKLGGLVAVIRELNNSAHEIRTASSWVLGKACQNNALVQKQILDHGALPALIKMVKSKNTEEAIKALYAISAVIRNNLDGQEVFYMEAGEMVLQDIMTNLTSDIRLVKKVVLLVADIVDFQLENSEEYFPFFRSRSFLKSVVSLLSSTDLDLQEKTLLAIRSLLQLESTEAVTLMQTCHLDRELENMRVRLEELAGDEDWRDFVRDVEILRREVSMLLEEKLEKVMMVPT